MRAESSLALHFWRFGGSPAFASRDLCWVAGRDRVTLEWLPEGEALLRERLSDPAFLDSVNRHLGPWGRLLGEAPPDAPDAATGAEYLFLSPFRPDPDAYARHLGLRFTLRRQGGEVHCEWSKDSLKKRVLRGLAWREGARDGTHDDEKAWEVRVQALPKFDPEAFLRHAFALPDPDAWSRVACHAVAPGEGALESEEPDSGEPVGSAPAPVPAASVAVGG